MVQMILLKLRMKINYQLTDNRSTESVIGYEMP